MFDWLFGNKKQPSPSEPQKRKIRLTEQQYHCLYQANSDRPIYAENPSHMSGQMPNNASCFLLRTVESLVKHGYLISDGKGGFLRTQAGEEAANNWRG